MSPTLAELIDYPKTIPFTRTWDLIASFASKRLSKGLLLPFPSPGPTDWAPGLHSDAPDLIDIAKGCWRLAAASASLFVKKK
jgi:hypothetical protein